MPESSAGSSNAASSILFVHVELGTRTALVQLIALNQQCMGSSNFENLGALRCHLRAIIFQYFTNTVLTPGYSDSKQIIFYKTIKCDITKQKT